MIYLIEDRLERQRQFLDGYKLPDDKIKVLHDLEFKDTEEGGIFSELESNVVNARVVLFHHGHIAFVNNTFLREKIKSFFLRKGISFVYFSGGISNANYNTKNGCFSVSVNSRIFYRNLRLFLDLNNDPRILCFGEKYLLNEFLLFINIISSHIHKLKNEESINDKDRVYLLAIVDDYISQSPPELVDIYHKVRRVFVNDKIKISIIRQQLQKSILETYSIKVN